MYNYWRSTLSLKWREALTKQLIDKYYSNRTFYVLETTREIGIYIINFHHHHYYYYYYY